MNVLILTPDRVGSTLLQRLVTIYMLRRGFDRPVINVHELSNGLEKYFNDTLGQEVLGKPDGVNWGYYQTLPEVIDLLESTNHYKTSRLAHYHLVRRQDSTADQIKFYEYLNRNFYIISCRRENLLEHALSWVIYSHSKNLNVYNTQEKIEVFQDIYANGITATKIGLESYLNKYVEYTQWVDKYFDVQSYFDYDTDMQRIEDYILNLDFMQNHEKNTWQDMFGQTFESWNACHRLLPNLLLNPPADSATRQISFSKSPISEDNWKQVAGPDWPALPYEFVTKDLPATVDQEIKQMFNMITVPVTEQQHSFLKENLSSYQRIQASIQQLQDNRLMVTGVPIKLQSLGEKKQIIQNFDQCVEWYNQWVDTYNFGKPYTCDSLDQLADQEEKILNNPITPLLTNGTHNIL